MNAFRWVMLCMGPLFIVWAFVSTLAREIWRAPLYAWFNARHEFATWKRIWKEVGKW